jgi:hypothetical protein
MRYERNTSTYSRDIIMSYTFTGKSFKKIGIKHRPETGRERSCDHATTNEDTCTKRQFNLNIVNGYIQLVDSSNLIKKDVFPTHHLCSGSQNKDNNQGNKANTRVETLIILAVTTLILIYLDRSLNSMSPASCHSSSSTLHNVREGT